MSWKSTPLLEQRLFQLAEIANELDFKLGIVYQGLDFARDPLPATRVGADLIAFKNRYGTNPAFDILGEPVVIWAGTWKFSRDDIARAVGPVRDELALLASEQSLDGYDRVNDLVDGNAYYWSSVDPDRHTKYREKLDAMSDAVHADNGLWIAPAAPGFDARLLGGTSLVPRRNGATLRERMDGALASGPDAIGLISWNEFSENTHVEPSLNFGATYLEVLADITGATFASSGEFDSATPASARPSATGLRYGLPLLIAAIVVAVVAFMVAAWRNRRTGPRSHPTTP